MKYLYLLGLLHFAIVAKSQIVNELKVGDNVPDNYLSLLAGEAANALEQKLVILDFWNIYCTACIKSMHKLDSLQSKYGKSIQIYLVTNNTSEQVAELFKRVRVSKPALTFINNDQVFYKLFPHQGVPHVVIIQNGKVRNTTFGYNINDGVIKSLIADPSYWVRNKHETTDFDPKKPIWANHGFYQSSHRATSSFSGRMEETGGSQIIILNDSLSNGFRFINNSLLDLYKFAFGKGLNNPFDYSNRIIMDSLSQSLIRPEQEAELDAWNEQNWVSYEISTSKIEKDKLYEMMQNDLLHHFNYEVRMERQKRLVLLLIRTRPIHNYESISQNRQFTILKDSIIMQKISLDYLLRSLNKFYENILPPIIDETGIGDKVDLIINSGIEDLMKLKSALNLIGLDLVPAERSIDMLVIKKRV